MSQAQHFAIPTFILRTLAWIRRPGGSALSIEKERAIKLLQPYLHTQGTQQLKTDAHKIPIVEFMFIAKALQIKDPKLRITILAQAMNVYEELLNKAEHYVKHGLSPAQAVDKVFNLPDYLKATGVDRRAPGFKTPDWPGFGGATGTKFHYNLYNNNFVWYLAAGQGQCVSIAEARAVLAEGLRERLHGQYEVGIRSYADHLESTITSQGQEIDTQTNQPPKELNGKTLGVYVPITKLPTLYNGNGNFSYPYVPDKYSSKARYTPWGGSAYAFNESVRELGTKVILGTGLTSTAAAAVLAISQLVAKPTPPQVITSEVTFEIAPLPRRNTADQPPPIASLQQQRTSPQRQGTPPSPRRHTSPRTPQPSISHSAPPREVQGDHHLPERPSEATQLAHQNPNTRFANWGITETADPVRQEADTWLRNIYFPNLVHLILEPHTQELFSFETFRTTLLGSNLSAAAKMTAMRLIIKGVLAADPRTFMFDNNQFLSDFMVWARQNQHRDPGLRALMRNVQDRLREGPRLTQNHESMQLNTLEGLLRTTIEIRH